MLLPKNVFRKKLFLVFLLSRPAARIAVSVTSWNGDGLSLYFELQPQFV